MKVKALEYILVYLVISVYSAYARPSQQNGGGATCGYESCPTSKRGMLNVHIVPHTHDDVGWLKTVDQYYYGSKTKVQMAGVQYILDSVVDELLKDPKKRFIYVESAFFFKWWKEQTTELQDQVKGLVNEGRLEFIGGAWSMNDEATTHYQSVIDQFAWGLRLLNDTFGECGRPRIGWQIDPFGHSREMASMFAQMGFDGLFFGRLDYQDKRNRLDTKTMEMIWQASANLGESSNLFTGAMYNTYQPPPGFCFDVLCSDEPIIDGKHSPDNNVNRRVNEFFANVTHMAKRYRSNNVIITMGDDFHYQNANRWYKNLDKLIKYANERQSNGSDINLFYSTPSCYLKSLHDAGITWPTKSDDFFPYASDPHAYWTGYFTSRPTIKRYERVGNHFLQVCKQITALSPTKELQFLPHLGFMRETMGVMQHHDAVTGTEKQQVAYDYAKRLSVAERACGANTRATLNRLTTGEDHPDTTDHTTKREYKFEFQTCTLLNISQCEITEESERFIVTLYNPLAHSTFEYIRVPVDGLNYSVMDYRNVSIASQIVPIPSTIRSLKFRKATASHELIFLAGELPPLGYKSFYVSKGNAHMRTPHFAPEVKLVKRDGMQSISSDHMTLTFDTNGFLVSATSNGVSRLISQEFLYYEAAMGDNREFKNRSSGAYIFRPKNDDSLRLVTTRATIKIYKGPLVEEVHQKFNDWVSQVIRLYRAENFAEFEWLVGPIPIEDGVGKEVISRFTSNIESQGVFYTDSNGREMIKRKINHRDTWKLKSYEKVAGNYYPITTKIALEDDQARMAVLVDRAQGGSSLQDGALELMVHRRLLHDDAFGVGEALNETAFGKGLVARGIHYLVLGPSKPSGTPISTQGQERFLQLQKLLPTWKFFSKATNYPYRMWTENYTNIFSGLTLSLPQNINLMTFEPWHDNELLIRFEHILEKDEDPEYSKPVEFYLKDVFRNLDIQDIRETTLDGNQWLEDSRRLEFVPDPEGTTYPSVFRGREMALLRLQNASKPALETTYYDEPDENSDERPTRSATLHSLNRSRMDDVTKLNLDIKDINERDDDDKYTIDLNPMQIRTFILTLEPEI